MNTGPTLYKHKYILPDAGADICTDKCENVYSLMLYINMYKYIHTHIYIHYLSQVFVFNGCRKFLSSFLEDAF